ncbi:MAG TPA: hypothetical protein VHD35_04845 [Chitinophagaceae bacterium]|nr:hypothetical protein [Chitinophagaceae bacterium]
MFNLFRKKESGVKVVDKILMTQAAKWKALTALCNKEQNVILIFWFAETLQRAQEAQGAETTFSERFLLASQVHTPEIVDKKIIFAEHYPLPQKEKDFFEQLQLQEVEVWSAMDEPLFKEFGSNKIVQMMKQFGMKEDQVIEHNMISKAIYNAQEKIENKVTVDQSASSQEEWLRKNWRAS